MRADAGLQGIFPQRTSCGPIEGTTAGQDQFIVCAFRNEQVAAPLKDMPCVDVARPCTAFRNEQVAAPLKASFFGSQEATPIRFPQRTSCGPIEGRRHIWLRSQKATIFPQRTSCGPIEGHSPCVRLVLSTIFPQRTSCGPIEGVLHTPTPPQTLSSFRNEQVAAPLKEENTWSL